MIEEDVNRQPEVKMPRIGNPLKKLRRNRNRKYYHREDEGRFTPLVGCYGYMEPPPPPHPRYYGYYMESTTPPRRRSRSRSKSPSKSRSRSKSPSKSRSKSRSKNRKHRHDDDVSVMTADSSLSGGSSHYREDTRYYRDDARYYRDDTRPYRDDISPCQDLSLMASEAAVALLDGFAGLMACCDSLIVKPILDDDRSCCTKITWGPDEVRYIDGELEDSSLESTNTACLVKTKEGAKAKCDQQELEVNSLESNSTPSIVKAKEGAEANHEPEEEKSTSPEWEIFDHFEVNQENIEIWNDNTDEKQKMIEAAFSADLSVFPSSTQPTESTAEDTSAKSSNTTSSDASTNVPSSIQPAESTVEDISAKSSSATSSDASTKGKKKRACACCGITNKKKAPVKLQVCSRCKTTYYCSAECQKEDWQSGHKDTCKAQVLL